MKTEQKVLKHKKRERKIYSNGIFKAWHAKERYFSIIHMLCFNEYKYIYQAWEGDVEGRLVLVVPVCRALTGVCLHKRSEEVYKCGFADLWGVMLTWAGAADIRHRPSSVSTESVRSRSRLNLSKTHCVFMLCVNMVCFGVWTHFFF